MNAKRINFVLLCLVLGAMLNIAAAWSIALFIGEPETGGRQFKSLGDPGQLSWRHSTPAHWPERPEAWSQNSWWCCTTDDRWIWWPHDGAGSHPMLCKQLMQAWGWPMRSMELTWPYEAPPSNVRLAMSAPSQSSLRTGLIVPWSLTHMSQDVYLPLMPVWLGFAINTLIYGMAVGVLLTIPGRLRRAHRRRRGQCVACGYELAGLAKCPECGLPRAPGARAASVFATATASEP